MAPPGRRTQRARVPASDDEAAALGLALEGARAIIDDGEGEAEEDQEQQSEPQRTSNVDDDVTEDDADKKRAAMMRGARESARRAAMAAGRRELPNIPADTRTTAKRSKRPVPSCPRRYAFYCRICLQWRVFKHVLTASVLPTLCALAAIYYFYFLPSAGLTFPDACLRGDLPTVRYFLRNDPRHPRSDGVALEPLVDTLFDSDVERRGPLHLAAMGNSTAMVTLLLDAGARIDLRDRNGLAVLHYAAHVGNPLMVQLLLDRGADVEARDHNSRTPLHIASMSNCVPCMAVLVYNGGSDLRALDADSRYATDYSSLFHSSSLQNLLDSGSYRDAQGRISYIESDKWESMKERERRPWGAPSPTVINPTAAAAAKAHSNTVKVQKRNAKKLRRKQRRRQSRAEDAAAAGPPSSSSSSSPPSSVSAGDDDDDDAALMDLFVGDASTADRAQRRLAAKKHAQQTAQEELQEIQAAAMDGQVDQDEFDV
jgi:hypothetical protein